MAAITWHRADDDLRLVHDTAVQVGKQVYAVARNYGEDPPSELQLAKAHGDLISGFLEWRGKSRFKASGQPLAVTELDEHSVRSETFPIPAPKGLRLSSVWAVLDERGNHSDRLYSNRFGRVSVHPSVKIDVSALAGGPPGAATVSVDAFQAEATLVVDPSIVVSLLVPWETDEEHSLTAYLRELAHDLADDLSDDRAETYSLLTSYLGSSLPSEPPPDWNVGLSTEGMNLGESEPGYFLVLVSAPTPARVAFAVQIQDADDANSIAVSDLMFVEGMGGGDVVMTASAPTAELATTR